MLITTRKPEHKLEWLEEKTKEEDFIGLEEGLGTEGTTLCGYSLITKELIEEEGSRE